MVNGSRLAMHDSPMTGGGIAEEIEEDVHVERLVGVDALVVAEIDRQAGVLQGPGQVERPSGTCSSRSTSSPYAHEEHVQVDQRDVGGHVASS